MPAYVETMFSVRKPVWHGLGSIIQEAPDSEQALVAAGLAWGVEKVALKTLDTDEVVEYFATRRMTDGRILGFVSPDYKVVQNRDAFQFTDYLVGDGDVRYETAGSLKNGKKVWMLARLQEDTDILGDEVQTYLLFSNSHDGTSAVTVAVTPIRVVCWNTLNLALSTARRTWSTRHVGDVGARMDEAKRVLGLTRRYMDRFSQDAERLANLTVTPSRWEEIVAQLLPIPEDASGRVKDRREDDRQLLYDRLMVPDLSHVRETAWGVVNAVADFEQHREPGRKTATWQENRFDKIVTGGTMLDRAYQLVQA